MLQKSDLFPIGIGGWGIGGFDKHDSSLDRKSQVKAVAHMFNSGMNFFEANLWYAEGHSVEIALEALRQSDKEREDIFVCQAAYLKNEELGDLEREVDKLLLSMKSDYIDTLQFTQSLFLRYEFEEIVKAAELILDKQKARFVSLTNENLPLLEEYHSYFGEKLFSHEVCLNLEIRNNITNGVIPYADENDIVSVIYQPLRRNATAERNWPLLRKLARKYSATQNQIILKWLVSKKWLPITKSTNIDHINQHVEALSVDLTNDDIKLLGAFSPPGFSELKVDWDNTGEGHRMYQLSTVFDEEYEKLKKI